MEIIKLLFRLNFFRKSLAVNFGCRERFELTVVAESLIRDHAFFNIVQYRRQGISWASKFYRVTEPANTNGLFKVSGGNKAKFLHAWHFDIGKIPYCVRWVHNNRGLCQEQIEMELEVIEAGCSFFHARG